MTEAKANASRQPIAWGRYLLVFFVAAWMFVLGVLVGRGTAPVTFDTQDLEKELLALRDAVMHKERKALEGALRGEDKKAPLEFYEALKSDAPERTDAIPPLPPPPAINRAEKPSTDTPPPTTPTQTPPHKTRIAIMAKSKAAVVKPAAPAKTEAPVKAEAVAPEKPAPLPQPAPAPATTEGKLTIQVASLKDGTAAERIVANLKKDGYAAYLSRIVIPDQGLWFRVRVGSYLTREQASTDMARLSQNKKNPILVEK